MSSEEVLTAEHEALILDLMLTYTRQNGFFSSSGEPVEYEIFIPLGDPF